MYSGKLNREIVMNQHPFDRGSEWRKWDLHVHTPFSIEQHFGDCSNSDTWENYIKDLENLPPEVKVLGINDYLFIDGYEKLLHEKNDNNRLANIELLLPVIEFRIAKFAGVDFGGYNRINLHVIFSNELDVSVIKSQFLNALQQSYKLEPVIEGTWSGVITKESLKDLGASIKASVPAEKRSQYGTDIEEGFRNLNIDEVELFKLLEKSSYLQGKYFIAVGKTEWDSLKWTDNSISSKKDIINRADFVFTASESVEKFKSAKAKLKSQGVNDLLLDCSDAHYFSSTTDKDRIGNCNTWIKSDPTFKGLQQVINEPNDRVFVGDIPESIRRVQINPTKVIDHIEVKKHSDSDIKDKWFDFSIPLNSALVAIIGNKGSGKSALADIIGLLGNTKRYEAFSFLTPKKFCSPRGGRSKHFQGKLTWCDQKTSSAETLNASYVDNKKEKVKYIPQSYLEDICSEVGFDEGGPFYSELKDVIFSRVGEADRLGFDNLDSLLKHRDKEVENSINQLISEIRALNREIIEVELKLSEKHKRELHAALTEKNSELAAHEVKPKFMAKPEEDDQAKASALLDKKKALELLDALIKNEQENDAVLAEKELSAEKIIKQIGNIERFINTSLNDISSDMAVLDLKSTDIITTKIKRSEIENKLSEIQSARIETRVKLTSQDDDSWSKKKKDCEIRIGDLTAELSAPQKKYQNYLVALSEWEVRKKLIIGEENAIGSITYLNAQLKKIKDYYPQSREKLVENRMLKASQIYTEKNQLREHYSKYYGSVQDYLDKHPIAKEQKLKISFDVSIAEREFRSKFLQHINQARSGNFYGTEIGTDRVNLLISKTNFDENSDVQGFLKEIMHDLEVHNNKRHEIEEQLKKGSSKEDLYNLIFSLEYLNPAYNLKWDEKDLDELSPGERGNLLLIFYLLLDQNDIPLIIDQPEENLDNQTVFKTLVPCVKEAKKRRQIILVTHNPNLAVVCDAEQIIHAKMHKNSDNEVVYSSGSIENPDINIKIVDVLEGTRAAFDIRDSKYWHI